MKKLTIKSLIIMLFAFSLLVFGGVFYNQSNINYANAATTEQVEQAGYLKEKAFSNYTGLTSINFTNVQPQSGTTRSLGATDQTGQTAWTEGSNCSDVTGYLNGTELTVYCPYTIYAPRSCWGLFFDLTNLTSITFNNFNTSNVTGMIAMFENCKNLTSLDVSNFDTSKVVNMAGMFSNCQNLTNLILSSFNTREVTDMSAMFYNCWSLHTLDISSFNTYCVEDMSMMFATGSSLSSLDLSHFNTFYVTNMAGMFKSTTINSLDLSHFDTSKVTDMSEMFSFASINSLNITSFDYSNVENLESMFYSSHCDLTNTNLDINSSKTTNFNSMFEDYYATSSQNDLNVSIDISYAVSINNIFNSNYIDSVSYYSQFDKTLPTIGDFGLYIQFADCSCIILQDNLNKPINLGSSLKEFKSPKILQGSITLYSNHFYVNENKQKITELNTYNSSTSQLIRRAYKVSIETNGGTGEETAEWKIDSSTINKTVFYNESITNLPSIQKNGYTLSGIYTAQENGDLVDLNNIVTTNTTLYAIWDLNTYNISIDYNNSTGFNPTTYTIKSENISLSAPSNRIGYTFSGWTSVSDNILEPTKTVTIPTGSFGDKDYKANWSPIIYSISYTLSGGQHSNPSSYTIESSNITLTVPSKDGYVFIGWISKSDNISGIPTKEITIEQGSTGNKDYTAIWQLASDLDNDNNDNNQDNNNDNNNSDTTNDNKNENFYLYLAFTGGIVIFVLLLVNVVLAKKVKKYKNK